MALIGTREDFVVKVLSLTPNETFSPVQIQKLFFLLEKRLNVGLFDFKPHHYGPYDRNLTALLTFSEKIEIKNINGIEHYQIKQGETVEISNFLTLEQREFVAKMINFVKSLSFKQLCMAIYKEFPEMAENSIFFKKS